MIDTYVAQLLLAEQKIAYLITDDKSIVVTTGGNLSLFFHEGSLLGLPLTDATPEFLGYEEQLAMILAGNLPQLRLEFVNRESSTGELYYITLTAYPHKNKWDQIDGLLQLIEDVSLMGQTNQRITQQHNELYLLHQRLSHANLRLSAANAELQALDELKSRFVSIAAHELRTPIASMLGYVDFLLDDDVDPLLPHQQKSLQVVGRSAKRLLTITSDLLDITRLEAGRLELVLESVNLEALVRAVLTDFHPEIVEKQLDVAMRSDQDLLPVLCDEKRSIQIFSNLISNAIKYTPAQGQIQVHLQHNRKDSTVIVSIADTGIGIPAVDLAKMGKAFFRATNVHKARVNGTGLGLHITQALLELQGGSLRLESIEGVGTTVFVSFVIDDGLFHLGAAQSLP
ncbi:MAG: HAMP domain-containing sensor histidine kinase [Caldilineaceae bacterium]